MTNPKPRKRPRMVVVLMETFGLSLTVASIVSAAIVLAAVLGVYWVFKSAPPRTIVLSSGPAGSTFQRYADQYKDFLAHEYGVTLKLVPSKGSAENLQRLEDAKSGIDVAFVPGGITEGAKVDDLVSLGSIAYQPVLVFYRSPTSITRLSQFEGKRIAVGPAGSGTRTLALTLLKANGIIPGGPTSLFEIDTETSALALLGGKIDAVFMMGDSASVQTLRALLRAPGIQLMSFAQADAYSRAITVTQTDALGKPRRIAFLNKVTLPAGSIDLGKNQPPEDIDLIGPTVELVARKGLHPALSDVLLDAARYVHGQPGLLQRRGEFPAPIEHEFKLSDDATRYYKSGKGFLYSSIHSFWLASIIGRVLVVFVPALLVLIPAVRLLPVVYRLRIQLRIYRCYRPLLQLERDAAGSISAQRKQELLDRLDEIDAVVKRVRVPASFAEQFYTLQGHIVFVRQRITSAATV